MRKHIILALMFSCFLATTLLADDNITFNEILNRVHNNNFELKAMQQQIEAAKSGIIQARFIPNPELEIELGNFGIDEIGVGIGQSFELGGKKKTRIEIAELDLKRSELAFELKKFELEITAFRKVLPLLSISGKLALLDSLITIERSTLETIQKRVEAGTTMPIDALRAEIDMEELFLEKRSANNEIAQLIQNLPILWSDSTVDFTSVAGVINHEITIPSIEIFQTSLLNHPEIRLTLDYQEDYDFIRRTIEALGNRVDFTSNELMELLINIQPELQLINFKAQKKYEVHLKEATPVRFKDK